MLLEHGADPNVRRNDNFTALSLAAFFGHAEIVETLMRHGANAQVATRFGTSPHMWAKARSFGDVARCLEAHRAKTSRGKASATSSAKKADLHRVGKATRCTTRGSHIERAAADLGPRSGSAEKLQSAIGVYRACRFA